MNVFNDSTEWLMAFLVVENMALLYYIIIPNKGKIAHASLLFIFSISVVFNFYQALVITPLYAIGIIGVIFFGISLHVVVPACMVICLTVLVFNLIKTPYSWVWISSALLGAVIISSIFSYQWSKIDGLVSGNHHQTYKPLSQNHKSELPQWIDIAKQLEFNAITEKYLKSGLVYQEFYGGDNFLWDGSTLQFEQEHLHDPLVTVATFFNGKPKLSKVNRLKILDYAYDSRHESTDRFWSGLNLKTSDVITNVQLFPTFRMAYTEMILLIKNDKFSKRSNWFNQEEAIYTFQLPEGAVVSSLSLWIAGKEAKARLTTKSKAQKAYNTIVGREMRDPSAVYWMEGNKIRVRVFPCTPEEDRQFKIGVTSPLLYTNGNLSYDAITFKGPDYNQANASINILTQSQLLKLESSSIQFEEDQSQLTWKGTYQPHWQITLKAPPLADQSFTFNGLSYKVDPLQSVDNALSPSEIYLDLNSSWTDHDLRDVHRLFSQHKLYANNTNGKIISIESLSDLLDLHRPIFSLFPFHKIENITSSLVITKGNILTPNLSDLEETSFKEQLFASLSSHSYKVKVFDLTENPSNYFRSLNEFGIFDYHQGSIKELGELIEKATFPVFQSNEDNVPIMSSQINIIKTKSPSQTGTAPDHLLRLFAYNQVMQEIGRNYFKGEYLNESLTNTASTANVVTPISSLIVLETLKDYKRFEIDENKDSLGNAEINSSGAVPEPHEWAIIITMVMFLLFVWFRRNHEISVKW